MRRILAITAVVGTAAALVFAAFRAAPDLSTGARPATGPPAGAPGTVEAAPAPRFEPNLGQADGQVRFLSRGQGSTMLMTGDGAVLKLRRPAGRPDGSPAAKPSRPATETVIGLAFAGANPDPVVSGHGRLAGVSNYLRGEDPGGWLTGVPHYARVTYRGLYDGGDLDWYANRAGELEFDLTLAPGVDPTGIRLRYTGAGRLAVDGAGALVLDAGGHRLRQAPPVVRQQVDGATRELSGRYLLHGDQRVGFAVAGYDPTVPLVIDPVIRYSTYLDGSGDDNPIWSDIDRDGNFYVTGSTASTDFPTTAKAFQGGFGGGEEDAFVTKLNRSGSGLVWSTYLGGDAFDAAIGLDVDRHGNVVVTGVTGSPGFPTTPGAFQPSFAGGDTDAFVTKLDANGSRLLFSTFLGGSGFEAGFISFFDRAGNVYVEGETGSADFPTTPGSFQPEFGGGGADGFVTKLRPNGRRLVYSTFVGGSGFDGAHDGELDRAGNFYLDGPTDSADFPVTGGAFQPGFGGGPTDAFLVLLSRDGSRLRFGSYLGGSGEDGSAGAGSWLDGRGSYYIPGFTNSADFPVTPGAYQTANAGGFDAFPVKVDLGKRHHGSGRRTAQVTAQAGSSGAWTGLTRDRMTRRR